MSTPQQDQTVCYRHPDRPSRIECRRCGATVCPDCMVDASVGFQCVDCARKSARATRQGMLPYGGYPSANPRLTSLVLIGVNAVVWLAITATGGAGSRLVDLLALLPLGICVNANTPGSYYPNVGEQACSAVGTWIPGVATGAPWQVITSVFVHEGFTHLLMNMVTLLLLGPIVEQSLGRARFLTVYALAGLGGSAAVMWLSDPQSQSLGASGALFGVMGALLVVAYKARGNVRTVLILLGINVAFTVVFYATISWQGHLGGLLIGAATAGFIVYSPRGPQQGRIQIIGAAVIAAAVLSLIVVRAVQLAS